MYPIRRLERSGAPSVTDAARILSFLGNSAVSMYYHQFPFRSMTRPSHGLPANPAAIPPYPPPQTASGPLRHSADRYGSQPRRRAVDDSHTMICVFLCYSCFSVVYYTVRSTSGGCSTPARCMTRRPAGFQSRVGVDLGQRELLCDIIKEPEPHICHRSRYA